MNLPTRPIDLPPTPPSAPAGAALPVPTAEPCLSCGTTRGRIPADQFRPTRVRGMCWRCYDRNNKRGAYTREDDTFEGFAPDFTPEPTGWPIIPALVAPLHPTLPAPTRWGTVIWFRRPEHDPVGQRLFDQETRAELQEAA